jgi:hypothetical protein
MQLAETASETFPAQTIRPTSGELRPILIAILLFAALSSYCAIRSEGFIAGDACIHYFAARHAFSNPVNFVDVWNRPLVTSIYAVPALLADREGIRIVSMCVAIGCGLVSWRIARGQGLKMPALALIFTLGQPLLFLHSFSEMTELPFALLLGLAFLAWQKERLWLAALLTSWSPLARPEGFGIVLILFVALLLYRKWACVLLLPIPIILWDIAGWLLSNRTLPWWGWLRASWPYSGTSLYASGYLLSFVALLPAVVSPFVLPAMFVGIGRSLASIFTARSDANLEGDGPIDKHLLSVRSALEEASPRAVRTANPQMLGYVGPGILVMSRSEINTPKLQHIRRCIFLTAAVPLFVLIVHSLLFWLGKMASSGDPRYLLVVAPFWGVLSARGWIWIFDRFNWRHSLGWAAAAVLLPPMVANIFVHAVPVYFAHDWETARDMVAWYNGSSLRATHPKVMTSHPGVYYFLGVNAYGSPNVQAWGRQSARARPNDAVLIWDPIFGGKNACAEFAVELDEIRKAGWLEVDVPKVAEDSPEIPPEALANPADPRRYWHVFIGGR